MGRVTATMTGDVLVVTLDNPAALNAWTMAMQRDVASVLHDAGADDRVRGVVLTGAGERGFCAGQHLGETKQMTGADVDAWLANLRAAYAAVLDCAKPTVAALNGIAAGSGYQLALLCDLRIAHAGVRMGQPEINSGIPSITGTYLTRQYVGHGHATEMMLRGRLLDADDALRIGLLHEVTTASGVRERAIELTTELADKPAAAFAHTKRALRDAIGPGLWAAFDEAAEADRIAWDSGEPQQVMDRFLSRSRATG